MRHQNWANQLEAVIETHKEIPFQWGVSDCVQFTSQCVGAIIEDQTAADALALAPYTTEEQANGLIQSMFGGDIKKMLDAYFERHPNKTFAQRGDIVLMDYNDLKICGIIDNSGRRVVCKTLSGIVFIPLKFGVAAWKVE